jgi:hypothetical protein
MPRWDFPSTSIDFTPQPTDSLLSGYSWLKDQMGPMKLFSAVGIKNSPVLAVLAGLEGMALKNRCVV